MENGLLTYADLPAIYEKLAAAMPKEAEQHAKTASFKGYDSDGYGYQFCVNRMNEVVGIGHWFAQQEVLHVDQGARSGGSWIVTVRMSIGIGNWIDGKWQSLAEVECFGGHESKFKFDAIKGASTNAFKKTVALFGVGRQAYEGTMDDDNLDADGKPGSGAPRTQTSAKPPTVDPNPQATRKPTKDDLVALADAAKFAGFGPDKVKEHVKAKYGCTVQAMTWEQYSECFDYYKGLIDPKKVQASA